MVEQFKITDMKLIKSIFILSIIAMLAASCEKELDPIIKVNPQPDADAPTIAINYPIQGKPFISPDPAAVS